MMSASLNPRWCPPGLVRTIGPTTEPITRDEMKLHSRIEIADDDVLVDRAIKAAREYCETMLEQSFITQTWRLSLELFPGREIWLPRPPLIAVSGITYRDVAGNTRTLATSVYDVDTQHRPGRVHLAFAQPWPATYASVNAVQITYTAGYGSDADSVPEHLKILIAQVAAHWLENREAVADGTMNEVPLAVQNLLGCAWTGTY